MRRTNNLSFFFLWCSAVRRCQGLFVEEAGKLDFLIATSGHGPVSTLRVDPDAGVIITSNEKSCHVASRRIDTGSLLWRRHVCSTLLLDEEGKSTAGSTVVSVEVSHGRVFTLDRSGSLRAWHIKTGALLWDAMVPVADTGRDFAVGTAMEDSKEYVVASAGGSSISFDAENGEEVESKSLTMQRNDVYKSLEATCADASLFVVLENGKLVAYSSDKRESRLAESEPLVAETDQATFVALLSCSSTAASILLTTARGSTTHATFSPTSDGQKVQAQTIWQAEEGLADISAALLLDASHYVGDLEENGKQKPEQLLQFSARLQSQWQGLTSSLLPSRRAERRDHIFGFVKVAVLVSSATSSAHRLYGIDTVGPNRGQLRYVLDLPADAAWHRLVHGAPNAAKSTHGINGATHSRELLVVSWRPGQQQVDWKCIDGSTGAVHTTGSVLQLTSSIAQIMPVTGTGTCRQGALLVTTDDTVVKIPADVHVDRALYTHLIDTESSMLTSKRIAANASPNVPPTTVGTTLFAGEEIVSVTYPSREEVVQSPCHVLGDDSLLLKYLNPHMAVFITKSSASSSSSADGEDAFSIAMKTASSPQVSTSTTKSSTKRKPLGVATDASPVPDTEDVGAAGTPTPNLFVNVVDTVSGRILYRASHAHVADYPTPIAYISENWIFYTYGNTKTRRGELGVLSLYEGMISSKGVTAFNSPDQTTTFSSLDAHNAKPVVLTKVFSLVQPATALAVTSSRGGISTRRLILALQDGQITSVERKVVDPRRPMGPLKDWEQKEGLRQYSELVPIVPFMTLSYHQTVEGVRSILTAPTDLESQSLILAYGGPDVFFARTSPARGFDLLPDSFNRPLLSLVVAALLITLLVVKKIAARKIKNQGWL